jgi:Ca2+:H+ antiporter
VLRTGRDTQAARAARVGAWRVRGLLSVHAELQADEQRECSVLVLVDDAYFEYVVGADSDAFRLALAALSVDARAQRSGFVAARVSRRHPGESTAFRGARTYSRAAVVHWYGSAMGKTGAPALRITVDASHVSSLVSIAALGVVAGFGESSTAWMLFALVVLAASVVASVHHAEVIAARVGPTLGALVLALAVTVIEVGLIVSMMTNDTPASAVVARDTVYSAVIIVTNGILGVCLLAGGLRFRELEFHAGGTSSLLAVLAVLSGLTLILPNYTTSTPGPTYNTAQLVFASSAALVLYGCLVFAQTKTHKDYFEPAGTGDDTAAHGAHPTPSRRMAWLSFVCLMLSLGSVIGFAKTLSPAIEKGIAAVGAPPATVGIVIALLVLAPETWAAVSAARHNKLQTSLNLALGSGAASIALTIPTVSAFAILTERPLVLGLDAKNVAFLTLTFVTSGLTLGRGSTTALQGLTHLVLLGSFLAFSFIP